MNRWHPPVFVPFPAMNAGFRTRRSLALALAATLLLAGCKTPPPNGITQVATIDALLAGVYDGHITLRTLRTYGDFGIGTFEGLDGEMILLDGTIYQVRADGKVSKPPLSEKTPFACVTRFQPDHHQSLPGPLDMKALEEKLDALVPEHNRFIAFIVHGDFQNVRTRSVPAQKKPYPPLTAVTKNQPVFSLPRTQGTLIGFRSPAFVQGVNVPGYHMHFLADDLSGGGHVLAFELTQGTLQTDSRNEWLRIRLPETSASFNAADLSINRTAELQAAEKETKPGTAKP